MAVEQDYIIRQIEMLSRFLAKLLFNRDYIEYKIEDEEQQTDCDRLYSEIWAMLDAGDICGAEDLLFEKAMPHDEGFLKLALNFYERLCATDEKVLAKAEFSRGEIYAGLKDIMAKCGVDTMGF